MRRLPPAKGVPSDMQYTHALCCAVSLAFPGYELLGWYVATDTLDASHLGIHRQAGSGARGMLSAAHGTTFHSQMAEFNESPLLLHLRPTVVEGEGRPEQFSGPGGARVASLLPSLAGAKELPLSLLVSDASGGGGLVSLPFRVETTESERLTIDHVANRADATLSPCERGTQAAHSSVWALATPPLSSRFPRADAAQLASTAAAVGLLAERLRALQAYVRAVQAREVPFDAELMRRVAAAASQVPATGGDAGLPGELRKVCVWGMWQAPPCHRPHARPRVATHRQDRDDFLLLRCLSSITAGAEAAHALNRHVRWRREAGPGDRRCALIYTVAPLLPPRSQAQQAGLGQQRFASAGSGGGGRLGPGGLGGGYGDRAEIGGGAAGGNRRRRQAPGASAAWGSGP